MMYKKIFLYLTLIGLSFLVVLEINAKTLFQLDFSNHNSGNAKEWLIENQFKFKKDPDDLQISFEKGRLLFDAKSDLLALISLETKINNAKRIRIEWGVLQYPTGANWANEMKREAIGVVVSFGDEKIDSGNWIVPNVPYFIVLFLGEKEKENLPYIGNYYDIGGRYICTPCGNLEGETVITDFELSENFKKIFGQKDMPPITSISFEIDIRDIESGSKTFIRKVEILSE